MNLYQVGEKILTADELSKLEEIDAIVRTLKVPDVFLKRPPLEVMRNDLMLWAAENKAVFDDEGEVGFGRPCVGITKHDQYPSYGKTYDYRSAELEVIHDSGDLSYPPSEVTDTYHKHNCLCVLGRGEYAIWQLWLWVEKLKRGNYYIAVSERKPGHVMDTLLHGFYWVYLSRREDGKSD